MLSLFLKILAIIGIFLLILLGIILFVLLMVLFVPITYKAFGVVNEQEKTASLKGNWLFGIVRFSLNFSQDLTCQLKIFSVDVLKPKDVKKAAQTGREDTYGTSSDSSELPSVEADPTPHGQVLKEAVTEANSSESCNPTSPEPENETSKQTFSDKINKLIFKIKSICDKIRKIRENINYYLDLLQEEDTIAVFSHGFQVILKILKCFRPRKLKLDVVFGFESPDTTGYVYGFLCMLYPYYGDTIHITPDFENQIMQGTFSCKGRICIIIPVINALRILMDKKFHKVLNQFKNGGNQNGR